MLGMSPGPIRISNRLFQFSRFSRKRSRKAIVRKWTTECGQVTRGRKPTHLPLTEVISETSERLVAARAIALEALEEKGSTGSGALEGKGKKEVASGGHSRLRVDDGFDWNLTVAWPTNA